MTEKISIDEALMPEEAAKFLGINTDRLRYLRRQGRIKGVKAGERITLYRLSDLRGVDVSAQKRGRKTTYKKSVDKYSDVR